MKKTIGVLALAVFLFPMFGFSDGSLTFRIGYFSPSASSDLWDIEFQNMSFTKSDFASASFGFSYEYFMTREISLVIGADYYGRSQTGYYRDWVGYTIDDYDYAFPYANFDGDFDLVHEFRTSISPLQMSLKFLPLGRRGAIIPYLGGGVSFYLWSVSLQGDLVDFEDQYVYEDADLGDVDVYGVYLADAHQHTKLSVGFHGFAGIMIPIARMTAIEAEFKYHYGKGTFSASDETRYEEGFAGFGEFDLGGWQVTVGINYWF